MSSDSEMRGLRRELVGTRAKLNPSVRAEIVAQIKLRGGDVADDGAPVEHAARKPGRPKKVAE